MNRDAKRCLRYFSRQGKRLAWLLSPVIALLGLAIVSPAVVAAVGVGQVPWLVTSSHLLLSSGLAAALAQRLPDMISQVNALESDRNEKLMLLLQSILERGTGRSAEGPVAGEPVGSA